MIIRTLLTVSLAAWQPLAAAGEGQLDSSPTLFSVLAALNAAGYDADLDSPSNHALRKAVRNHIAAKRLPVVDEIRRYIRERRPENDTQLLSLYISFALAVEAPTFKYRMRRNDLPPEVAALAEFPDLMKRFHEDAGIDQIWRASQPAIDAVIERYHEPVARAVLEANAYLRNPTSGGGRRFQVYVDLLAAPNQVQNRLYGDEFFVIVTSSPEPQVERIRQAYLTHLIDPLTLRYQELINKKKGLGDFAQAAPLLPSLFKDDFNLLTQRSLVRAIEARMFTGYGASAKRQQAVDQALAEGFVLTPYFAEALVAYEKQEQSLRFYFADLINGIDLKKEDKRLEGVKFADKPFTRVVRQAESIAPPEPKGVEKTLAEAEDLYSARKLGEARNLFLNALQQTENRQSHAKAYYGLARVATLENKPELADRLFKKTLELQPEPLVKAWTLVYLGRLADIDGQDQQAADHYKSALGTEGISDAAKQMAEKGLQGGFRRKPQ
ncbi:MAG: hypothetical protein SFV51_09860 [Bryobacteraceae bacterium]|nr:hypothetical protein [Bryobacteraceae bacterium]